MFGYDLLWPILDTSFHPHARKIPQHKQRLRKRQLGLYNHRKKQKLVSGQRKK